MLKISKKELIICIITIIALFLVVTTDVFATVPDLNTLVEAANNTNEFESIPEGNNTVNNTANNTANNVVNNATNNTTSNNVANNNVKGNTVIPNAGVDYSIVFVIVIFGLSAIYAYKKIRDYKNV